MKYTFSVRSHTVAAAVGVLAVVSGCSSGQDPHVVEGPLSAAPVPHPTNVERINNGSIFQPGMTSASLFTDERKARFVGDNVKINIAETLNATSTVKIDAKRETALTQKGPGGKSGVGLATKILDLDATASGSSSIKGGGTTSNSGTFTAVVPASVINVLPNGNLVVAGDRAISLNGDVKVLRFSGILNPRDIHSGNAVDSADVVNARLEVLSRGELSDTSSRNWIQRVIASSLAFW